MGDFWPAGPLLLRPPGPSEALECAEELARSKEAYTRTPARVFNCHAARLNKSERMGK